jgi:hypothetical protein
MFRTSYRASAWVDVNHTFPSANIIVLAIKFLSIEPKQSETIRICKPTCGLCTAKVKRVVHAQTPDDDTLVDALHSLLLHPKTMRMS